ncbi:MAG: hypothetical protein IJ106_05645 [Parasporobacterium sp.]|nr:hypothetical protein [Parasporobacterium sp.]
MKRYGKGLAIVLALGLMLSVTAFAAPADADTLAGTYTDGEHTLIIAPDHTFIMEETGQNMEGEEFLLTVTGTAAEDGSFEITGLYDGEINLVEVASPEQVAADLARVIAAFEGGRAEDGNQEDKDGKAEEDRLPGTYTDGEHTLVIAEDLTFTMEKTGQNMEGVEFVLTVTGQFAEDGTFEINGLYDGEINLIEVASEEQVAADAQTVREAFEGGKVKEDEGITPGTYSDGEHTLVVAEDMTFTMEKTGQNMEGEEFVLLVTGTVTADGAVEITGLYDGEINLIEVASEEQVAADLATVEAALKGGRK